MSDHNGKEAIFMESLHRMAAIAEHSLLHIDLHIRRVSEYARILGAGYGLSQEEAGRVADACLLHDVGMVSVPIHIVHKAGNLTNDEWEIIKKHPFVGASLLNNSQHPVIALAETVALTHHERWDGSGYPRGLAGEATPLAGRICGLSDVFDTLTHARAYKAAQSPDEVLLLLQESSGSFFEARLVEVFTLAYPEILAARNAFQPAILVE